MAARNPGRKSGKCSDSVSRLISRMDRIVIRLHRYGVSSQDIAMIINSTENRIDARIRRIEKSLEEADDRPAMNTTGKSGTLGNRGNRVFA